MATALVAITSVTTMTACSGEKGAAIPDVVVDFDAGATEPADAGQDPAPVDAGPSAEDAAPEAGEPEPPPQKGQATYHDADGTGACGFPPTDDFLIASLNDHQFSKATCGKCIEVTGPRGSVTVRIVDTCERCKTGDVDLSMTAFSKIAKLNDGRVDVTWRFTTCP